MKHNQNKFHQILKHVASATLLLGFIFPIAVKAAALDLATLPLANSPTVPIQPNLLFVLDDSGSMTWEYMPDVHNKDKVGNLTNGLRRDLSYNTIAYNPAVVYLPPAYFDNSGVNTIAYPSQTSASTSGWTQVKNDAYLDNSKINLTNDAYFYITIPGEFCKTKDLKDCNAQTSAFGDYTFPAPIRHCKDDSDAEDAVPGAGKCQAEYINASGPSNDFRDVRNPDQRKATVNIANSYPGGGSRVVTSLTVGGQEIMSSQTDSQSSGNGYLLEYDMVARINDCTYQLVGNCTITGFRAEKVGGTLDIYTPEAITATPVLSHTGGNIGTSTIVAFSADSDAPGKKLHRVIVNSPLGYPATVPKVTTRTDCAGASCTYEEEMENYANWYTYYRDRMQLMKTATSRAFKNIGSDFRVALMTIHPGSGGNDPLVDFDTFSQLHKAEWYQELFSTVGSGGTPLRTALSTAGRIYAAKENVGGAFADPIQYECQQNFTLLTTDGFWRNGDGVDLDGNQMGDPDGAGGVKNSDEITIYAEKPKLDGLAKSNTLADVAYYYRETDLRTSALGNCNGNPGVCQTDTTANSSFKKQTMVTLTLGLGVDGTLAYSTDYKSGGSADYNQIVDGSKNWPEPKSNNATAIDDLWHAAVNGGGTYFSAKEPNELVRQLEEAVASIKVKVGTGSAAATSTLNPISGDEFAYVASYTSGHWIGNLEKRKIDLVSGGVGTETFACVEDVVVTTGCAEPSTIEPDGNGGYHCVTTGVTDATSCTGNYDAVTDECSVSVITDCSGQMSAQANKFTIVGSARVPELGPGTGRDIYFNLSGTLKEFTFSNLPTAYEKYFDAEQQKKLTQWPLLTTDQQTSAIGTNLVNYLRGLDDFEDSLANVVFNSRVYRQRRAVLGDLVDAKPAFVGASTFNYGDSGYQAFKSSASIANRAKTVYVGSNDGMLHAFDAVTLKERWAYIPTLVLPKMWKLADANYSAKHDYYVNGDITVSDICISGPTACATAGAGSWKTILVGSLGAGGRGYYALDITSPLSPKLLWEIDPTTLKGSDIGFSYSNPTVTKRNVDGQWVVLFASGYNNMPDDDIFYNTTVSFKPNELFTSGNGEGYLYVVNAYSGEIDKVIGTGEGGASAPSGLARIKAFADNGEVNNAAQYVYGGDLEGNLWRFDIDTNSVNKIAKFNGQPITTSPELGATANKTIVIVGTGKYLELSDLTNNDQQTLYAISDLGASAPTLVNPRATIGVLDEQKIVADLGNADSRKSDTTVAKITNFAVDRGWFVDLPDPGERQNVEAQLVLGTLLMPTTVPTSSACQPAGYGWFNYFDYRTGRAVTTAQNVVSQRTSAPSVGFNVVYINGKPKVSNNVADDKNPKLLDKVPFSGSGTGFQLKRSIWREIIE